MILTRQKNFNEFKVIYIASYFIFFEIQHLNALKPFNIRYNIFFPRKIAEKCFKDN